METDQLPSLEGLTTEEIREAYERGQLDALLGRLPGSDDGPRVGERLLELGIERGTADE